MLIEAVPIGPKLAVWPIAIVMASLPVPSPSLHADSFVMTSGKIIDGSVASGSDVSVFVKDKNGLLQPIMLADVAEVRIDLDGGETVIGQLTGFQDDTYEVVKDQWTLFVRGGSIIRSVVAHQGEASDVVVPNAGGPAIDVEAEEPASPPAADEPMNALKKRATM